MIIANNIGTCKLVAWLASKCLQFCIPDFQ
jgi:hypothetical protein